MTPVYVRVFVALVTVHDSFLMPRHWSYLCAGTIKGVQYFSCAANRGLMVSLDEVKPLDRR